MWWAVLLLPTCVKSIQQFTLLPLLPLSLSASCTTVLSMNVFGQSVQCSGRGEPVVCQCSGWGNMRVGGGALLLGVVNLMAAGQRLGTASSYWCHRGFSGINTLKMCVQPWYGLFLWGNRKSQYHPSIFIPRLPLFMCPYNIARI